MELAGRQRLHDWVAAKPANFFEADQNLQRVLHMHWGDATFAEQRGRLSAFGAVCTTAIDAAAQLNDRIGNHPRLERYTGIGEHIEAIEFHPSYHEAGRAAYESGLLAIQSEPGHTLLQGALFYLLCHTGEMDHACPIACTAGAIRALQQVAAPELRERYLPPLLDPHYNQLQHAAQFLTEIQGGSDVGANECRAIPLRGQPDTWLIRGEKWFCSNINADQFLLTARPDGAPAGTAGLSLFLVPRRRDDGSVNGFEIRRLKTKIGTRTMASAEVDFVDAQAYPVGPLADGFRNAVELVLNTSRYLNALACCGMMARALLEARSYAAHRRAFGQSILSYALVAENLALMTVEVQANLASSLELAALVDAIDTGRSSAEQRAMHRLLVNLNKMCSAVATTDVIHRAIETLGGNGAIEDFSILPRLYRDAIVLESWEGTHNVLCLQALRDMARYELHQPLLAHLETIGALVHPRMPVLADDLLAAVARARELVATLLTSAPSVAQAHARRLADTLIAVAQGAYLLRELDWEAQQGVPSIKGDVVTLFFNHYLRPGYNPLHDPAYVERVLKVAADHERE